MRRRPTDAPRELRRLVACLALLRGGAMAPLPWGKRPCQDYLATVRAQPPPRPADGLVDCHPLLHLRWTVEAAPELTAGDGGLPTPLDDGPPTALDFDAVNSATRAAAAVGVDWRRCLALAREYAAGTPPPVVACAPGWRVADVGSLEVVVACACFDPRGR
mmetsp:Transcript_33226/g.102972  ORF Transcript_33226/g.102972 Transcript_33226/m.102972 type:complete len:161 (-) Transcript_33226:110-592(-)